MALDFQTLAEQATALYDRLLLAVEEGTKGEGLAGITQRMTELSRRRHFVLDPELREGADAYLKVANQILQAKDRDSARELTRKAGHQVDTIVARAGGLYRQALAERGKDRWDLPRASDGARDSEFADSA